MTCHETDNNYLTTLCADAGLRGEDAQTAIAAYLGGGDLSPTVAAELAAVPPAVRTAKLTARYGSDGARVAAIVLAADPADMDLSSDEYDIPTTLFRALDDKAISSYSRQAAYAWIERQVDAETRLTEMREQLEMVAQEVSDGVYHGQPFDHELLSDVLREVARG